MGSLLVQEQQTGTWPNCTDHHKSAHQNEELYWQIQKSGVAWQKFFQALCARHVPSTFKSFWRHCYRGQWNTTMTTMAVFYRSQVCWCAAAARRENRQIVARLVCGAVARDSRRAQETRRHSTAGWGRFLGKPRHRQSAAVWEGRPRTARWDRFALGHAKNSPVRFQSK